MEENSAKITFVESNLITVFLIEVKHVDMNSY